MAVTMRGMLEAGVHFGHQTQRWNPKMRPYIYTARNGVHIINLQKTIRMYREAEAFVNKLASRGETILFVATKRQAQTVIEEAAKRCKMPYVTNRWLGGMLTNYETVKQSIDKLGKIEGMLGEESVGKLAKKEVLTLERSRDKLMKNLGGIREMGRLPSALFIVDPKREHIAVAEAQRLNIPIVALVDTNCDPDVIDYVVPANDDAIRGVQLFSESLADAILEGVNTHKEQVISGFDKEGAAGQAVVDGVAVEAASAPEVVRKPSVKAEEAAAEAATVEAPAAEVSAPAEEAPAEAVEAAAEEAPAAEAAAPAVEEAPAAEETPAETPAE